MEVIDHPREEESRRGNDKEIEIKVNNHRVVVIGNKQTGSSIKEAAIAQGAGIERDYVLSIERGNGQTQIIGDDDPVTVNKNSCFLAIPDDDNSRSISGNVEAALDHIRKNFAESRLDVHEDGKGGAFVVLDPVPMGHPYCQDTSWVGFHVTAACEYADCYPHFFRPDLSRVDGGPLGEGFGSTTFQIPGAPRQAVQVSRRTNKAVTPSVSNPLVKLLKVLRWLRNR